jgi:hypothetical protein
MTRAASCRCGVLKRTGKWGTDACRLIQWLCAGGGVGDFESEDSKGRALWRGFGPALGPSPARLGISEAVSATERLGWPPAQGKGSGQDKKRSGAADLEISKGASPGRVQVCGFSRRSLSRGIEKTQSCATGEPFRHLATEARKLFASFRQD